MPIVSKSGNLNFLEPSGPVQACNGIDFTYEFARDSKTLFRLLKEEIPVREPAAKNV